MRVSGFGRFLIGLGAVFAVYIFVFVLFQQPLSALVAAPFLAPLGWRFADRIADWEPRFLTDPLGFLLFATARKAA